MPNITRSKKQVEQDDLVTAKKIAPKLRKHLINTQIDNAAKVVKQRSEVAKKVMGNKAIGKQAAFLAYKALVLDKVWQRVPPFLDSPWMRYGLLSQELITEFNQDLTGFASYLAQEYVENYLALDSYPNPMKEECVMWFWNKMNNIDLPLAIKADQQRQQAGNQSAIIIDKDES